MAKFKIGQEVTPTKRDWNVVFGKIEPGDMPKFGKIYTVGGYPLHGNELFKPEWWGMVMLEEMGPTRHYHEDSLEAVLPADAIEEALENVELV